MHDWTARACLRSPRLGPVGVCPDELRSTSTPLLGWLSATSATKVAVHFDVDTIDADEIQLGVGLDVGVLTSAEARRLVADIDASADVVELTIAEFVPAR
jgi:arginase